jgi:hypothetical protein
MKNKETEKMARPKKWAVEPLIMVIFIIISILIISIQGQFIDFLVSFKQI